MEAEWNDAATIKLIELYDDNRLLYDPCHHNYRNRYLKIMKENTIAVVLGKSDKKSKTSRQNRSCNKICQPTISADFYRLCVTCIS